MANQPLELILCRQFVETLNIAAFIVDPEGNLLFYNSGAEEILGLRFSETGSMPVDDWATTFKPCDEDGNALPPSALPLVQTLNNRNPAYGSIYITSKKGNYNEITISSIPIESRTGVFMGAMALFWITKST